MKIELGTRLHSYKIHFRYIFVTVFLQSLKIFELVPICTSLEFTIKKFVFETRKSLPIFANFAKSNFLQQKLNLICRRFLNLLDKVLERI